MKRAVFSGVVLILLCLAIRDASAPTAGTLRGYIKDDQGAALPGVTVSAASTSVAGVHTAVSDTEGFYRLIDLPPADLHTVTAELQGFSKFARPNVSIRAGLNIEGRYHATGWRHPGNGDGHGRHADAGSAETRTRSIQHRRRFPAFPASGQSSRLFGVSRK